MKTSKVTLSRHALKRMKERVGVPRKAALATARKAYNEGLIHSEARGRLLRWLDRLFLNECKSDQTRIFGQHVYLFAKSHLITVIHLPHELEGAVKSCLNRRKSK